MLMVKADKDSEAGKLPDEKILGDMAKFNEEMVKAGVMLAGEGLQASSKGARIRFSGGKPTVIDGPFTEAKELIAGFTMIEAASREEALEWLKRWPQEDADGNTSLEIREGGCPGGLRGVAEDAPPLPEGFRRFMILLKANDRAEAGIVPDNQWLGRMAQHNDEAVKAGVLLMGEGLKPSTSASRMKFSRGKPSVMDGPFA